MLNCWCTCTNKTMKLLKYAFSQLTFILPEISKTIRQKIKGLNKILQMMEKTDKVKAQDRGLSLGTKCAIHDRGRSNLDSFIATYINLVKKVNHSQTKWSITPQHCGDQVWWDYDQCVHFSSLTSTFWDTTLPN